VSAIPEPDETGFAEEVQRIFALLTTHFEHLPEADRRALARSLVACSERTGGRPLLSREEAFALLGADVFGMSYDEVGTELGGKNRRQAKYLRDMALQKVRGFLRDCGIGLGELLGVP
jgi:hypothetical protein